MLEISRDDSHKTIPIISTYLSTVNTSRANVELPDPRWIRTLSREVSEVFTRNNFLRFGVAAGALVLAQGSFAQTIPGMMVVTAYGAKGNGVTDDTKAIQAAVNAAEAGPGCGTISFPAGTYVINSGPIVVNHIGCLLRGEGSVAEGTSYGGAVLVTDVSGQDIIHVNDPDNGMLFPAPSFENLSFYARSNRRTQYLLHTTDSNQGRVSHCSFYGGLAGIYMDGVTDGADWSIDGSSIFDDNVVGLDQNPSTGGNVITDSYIVTRQAGDIGVRWQSGGGGGKVTSNHFSASSASTSGPAVWTGGNQTLIAFNSLENYAPAVTVSHTGGSNNGRGTRIIGNYVIGNCYSPVSAWNIDSKLATSGERAVISLNTYICTTNTDGQ
jgi:hypothetical protein